jgi:hypothetical protein
MKMSRVILTTCMATALALFLRLADARDPTVGLCTQKDQFQKRQEQIDKLVQQLSSAKTDAQKKTISAGIVKQCGTNDIENLIRYREPAMKLVFVELLKHKNSPIRARALYGLKMVGDESVVKGVCNALNDAETAVREMAANCLSHIGNAEAVTALEKRKGTEKDPQVLSSIDAALGVLAAGAKPYKEWKETLVGPDGAKRVEYAWCWKGQSSFNDYDAKPIELPVAETFCYPINAYSYKNDLFAPYPRNSFAAGGTHAAEDCAWFREGCSYYAIADGVVRMVQGAGGDWGFLIVLEHKLPSGDYIISLYGHAAFDVLVKAGDTVKAGQKIGTQGLSCSVENGGYGSHVHFGIGDGPFRRPKAGMKGDSMPFTDEQGKQQTGKILRFGYSADAKDQYGFPRLVAVVQGPDGKPRDVSLPDEPTADQIAWMQAYIKDCVGWLNPEKFLPEHCEPKKTK